MGLRRVLGYIDPCTPVDSPMCFRVAAAACAAEGGSFAGEQIARGIFECSLAATRSPTLTASHVDCVAGLFGASGGNCAASAPSAPDSGEVCRQSPTAVMGLDVLVRHLVPPAAAAVILSRVLSSWAASEAGNDADAVDVILSGLRSD